MTAIDWVDLLNQAESLDAPLSDQELAQWKRGELDGTGRMWNALYVHAVQQALEQNDTAQLNALLAVEVQPPKFLLPLFAQIAPLGNRPAALTAYDDRLIRYQFDLMTSKEGVFRMPAEQVKQTIATRRDVHKKTIERSLARTNKKKRRKPPTV